MQQLAVVDAHGPVTPDAVTTPGLLLICAGVPCQAVRVEVVDDVVGGGSPPDNHSL